MNKNQFGFGVAGILIIVVVIMLIGGIGWTVFRKVNAPKGLTSAQDVKSSTEKAYPDKGLMDNSIPDSNPETYSQNKSKIPGEFINSE
ncbi:MAG: hypothetical protein JWP13_35, partial [Candidatus Saccharibacteria bacterium]|nr:hypothetical protein [Candidatus Saccharibacteria bacterium]